MKFISNIALFVLFVLAITAKNTYGEATNSAPVPVVLDYPKGTVSYEVESKVVKSERLLDAFSSIKKERGRNVRVVVLADQRNSLAALSNIRGIIEKAGFSDVQYFYFTADRQMMAEIKLDKAAIAFSLKPSRRP